MQSQGVRKSLIVAGAVLFLLGLLQGATIQLAANPRMALSAHLTAVQSGMALMIAGMAWRFVRLNAPFSTIAQRATIVGMYGLWVGLTLSAITGASDVLPIAGAGHRADRFIEIGVAAIVYGSSALMTLGWLVFVVGLFRSPP